MYQLSYLIGLVVDGNQEPKELPHCPDAREILFPSVGRRACNASLPLRSLAQAGRFGQSRACQITEIDT
jgi:hypothetical protein